jgi:hypothetical protein
LCPDASSKGTIVMGNVHPSVSNWCPNDNLRTKGRIESTIGSTKETFLQIYLRLTQYFHSYKVYLRLTQYFHSYKVNLRLTQYFHSYKVYLRLTRYFHSYKVNLRLTQYFHSYKVYLRLTQYFHRNVSFVDPIEILLCKIAKSEIQYCHESNTMAQN